MTTPIAYPPTDDGQWEFLEDTYWYVPTPYLPAVVLVNLDPAQTGEIVDQTIWHIEEVINGNVIGQVAATIGTGWTFSTLVGSITPSGSVSFSFTPEDPSSDITIGKGAMVESEGQWFFEMQMTTGSGALNITHWAYMGEVAPGDRAWDSLPGYPDVGVASVFDGDPSNDAGAASPLPLTFGTNGPDVMTADAGSTGVLFFGENGKDKLTGSSAADGLVGGAGRDTINGKGGADDIYGDKGADTLKGGGGEDAIDGGNGRDMLKGGGDGDLLHGGNGADRFKITAVDQSSVSDPDTIVDFGNGNDRIDLRKIDAKPADKGDDAFRFIGMRDFTGREGQLRYEHTGGDTIVYGDTDGDAAADLAIHLTGIHDLSDSDFLL